MPLNIAYVQTIYTYLISHYNHPFIYRPKSLCYFNPEWFRGEEYIRLLSAYLPVDPEAALRPDFNVRSRYLLYHASMWPEIKKETQSVNRCVIQAHIGHLWQTCLTKWLIRWGIEIDDIEKNLSFWKLVIITCIICMPLLTNDWLRVGEEGLNVPSSRLIIIQKQRSQERQSFIACCKWFKRVPVALKIHSLFRYWGSK